MTKKANQEESRQHNSRLVLNTIYQQGQISRAAIARHTHLTRTTVSEIAGEFIESGLVFEAGQAPSRGGKPATLLQVDENARMLIGIDLAESQFCGALVNLRGQIVHRVCQPIPAERGQAALTLVYTLIETLLQLAEQPVIGIGIGVPGLMDPGSGIVRQAIHLDWRDLPLGKLLHTRFQFPIYLANDCQVSALGEYTFGRPPATPNLILIKAGRGIGAGIVLNGQLFYGDHAGAGEIGHIQMQPDGELCRCGNRGCLETIASTRALCQKAPAAMNNLETLRREVQAGNPQVLPLITAAGQALGEAAKHIASLLNVQQIRIAGSLALFGDDLFTPIRQNLQNGVLPALADQTQIEAASLGDDIVILGAASLVLKNELGLV